MPENPSKAILAETKEKMTATVNFLDQTFKSIRSGRATSGLVEGIRVEYYGSPTPLNQLAQISVPEPRLIVIKPYDVSAVKEIEKSILKSDLGITPQSDGKMIRLQVPMMSEEQRKKQAATLKERAEESKVALRNIRKDVNKKIDGIEKTMPEDDVRKLRDDVQKELKTFEDKVNELLDKKTKEAMQI